MADLVPAGGNLTIEAWNFPWQTRVLRDGRVVIAPARRQAGEKAAAAIWGGAGLFLLTVGFPVWLILALTGAPIVTNLIRGYAPWPKITLSTRRVSSHQVLTLTCGSGRKAHEVHGLSVRLCADERGQVRSRLRSSLKSRMFLTYTLATTEPAPNGSGYYDADVKLPALGVPTFTATHSALVWTLHIHVQIAHWPPVDTSVTLDVAPDEWRG